MEWAHSPPRTSSTCWRRPRSASLSSTDDPCCSGVTQPFPTGPRQSWGRDSLRCVPWLVRGLSWLTAGGAEVIAMPCNTAHAFLPELRRLSGVPILDMVECAMSAAVEAQADTKVVGLLATRGTRAAVLYERAADPVGVDIRQVDEQTQARCVDAAIAAVKRNDLGVDAARLVANAIDTLSGVDVVITGCTGLSLVSRSSADHPTVVDSTDVLALEVYRVTSDLRVGGLDG